jgi:tetratricopeptide (TPR) repeat protein
VRAAIRRLSPPLLITLIVAFVLSRAVPDTVRASREMGTEHAAQLFERAAVQPDASPFDVFRAGTAWIGLDDLRAAKWLELAAQERSPKIWRDAAFNLGVARFYAREYAAAARTFREILERDPADADARYNYELSLKFVEDPLPREQQQRTEPDDGSTDPTVTPTPESGGFDGPTPTPPREELEPDPTATPEVGSGDFGAEANSTPAPVESGSLTIEDALRLLDAAARDADPIIPFSKTPRADGEPEVGW